MNVLIIKALCTGSSDTHWSICYTSIDLHMSIEPE